MRRSNLVRARAPRFLPRLEMLEERSLLSIGFGPPINTPTGGTHPFSVVVADFNGDGIPDLAVSNRDSNTVSVLLGNGDGTFHQAPGSPFAAGSSPEDLVAVDFSGNGHPPGLAVVNPTANSVTVLLNNGSGQFQPSAASPVLLTIPPVFIAAGDFNGDHKPDLVVAGFPDQKVHVLLGDGQGGFQAGADMAIGGQPGNLAVGDFDGDKKLDVAVTRPQQGDVMVLFGDGGGGFRAQSLTVSVPGGVDGNDLAVGDFNGDGRPDLAVANTGVNTSVTVLLQNSAGQFTPSSPILVGGSAVHRIAVGALNPASEGAFSINPVPDLAVTTDLGVAVLQNDGHGGFTAVPGSPFSTGTSPQDGVIGDFNGDGALDLATANFTSGDVSVRLSTAGTHTTLAVTPPLAQVGMSLTLTATVTTSLPGSGQPGGNVDFFDGLTLLGRVPLDAGGHATLAGASLSLGTHMLLALYDGSPDFAASNTGFVPLLVHPVLVVGPLGPLTNLVTHGKLNALHVKVQVVLTNPGTGPMNGPFALVLKGLNRRVRLLRKKGFVLGKTHVQQPLGSPYVRLNLAQLAPGRTVTVTLNFDNPSHRRVQFTPVVVVGNQAL